jgi:hypothetical protein
VFAYSRLHPRAGRFLGLANFGDFAESCNAEILYRAGLPDPHAALVSEGSFELFDGRVHLPPLGFLWLVERPS